MKIVIIMELPARRFVTMTSRAKIEGSGARFRDSRAMIWASDAQMGSSGSKNWSSGAKIGGSAIKIWLGRVYKKDER